MRKELIKFLPLEAEVGKPTVEPSRRKWLPVSAACKRLCCAKSTCYELMARGELVVFRLGPKKGFRVADDSIDSYIERQISKYLIESDL